MDKMKLERLLDVCINSRDATRQIINGKTVINFVRNGKNEMVIIEEALYEKFGMCKEI